VNIGDLRTTRVIVTFPETPLAEAARLMRQQGVGALVVVDSHDPQRQPVGMLTDRDIVRGQHAKGADLYCLTVNDVMSRNPLTLQAEMSLAAGIEAMKFRVVRRAPVVDRHGALVGIVTLDDLLPAVAAELKGLAQLIGAQARKELPAAQAH
jgi:CBS domain-containing protein